MRAIDSRHMRPLFLLVALALAGCDAAFDSPLVCTEEFVTIDVEVVDAFGRSVEGLAYQSVNERTGEVLPIGKDEGLGARDGRYPVATDAHAPLLRVDGDPVVFTASGAGLLATARYVLSDDGCHVRKEDGPEQITAETL